MQILTNVQVAHVKMAPSVPTQQEATSAHAWEDGLQGRIVMKVNPHVHKAFHTQEGGLRNNWQQSTQLNF